MRQRPTGPRRKRRCRDGSKVRHRTFSDASAASKARMEHGADELFIYECPHCRGWHLTSLTPTQYGERKLAWATGSE